MKGAILAVAASVLGLANAGVHKMPLKKISLSEQLAGANIDTHIKHLGQKYMGVRPQSHADEMFKAAMEAEGGDHTVPVSNFLNAQCKYFPQSKFLQLKYLWQISPRSRSEPPLKLSR